MLEEEGRLCRLALKKGSGRSHFLEWRFLMKITHFAKSIFSEVSARVNSYFFRFFVEVFGGICGF